MTILTQESVQVLTVQTQRLTKRYAGVTALDQCTCEASAGEIVGLLGPNGAGKTTFLRLLMGFLKPTSGTANVMGFDVVQDSVRVRESVAYLPGDARLPRAFSGKSVLEMWSGLHPFGDLSRSLHIAGRLDLELRRKVGMMSTGMRQKLALAIVLSVNAPVMILDEPTANLDPSVRREVLELVAEAKGRGQTVLFSNHVLSEMEETCDRVIFVKSGRIESDLPMDSLRDRYRVKATLQRSWLDLHPLKVDDSMGIVLKKNEDSQTDGEQQIILEGRGDLAPVLSWLADAHPHSLRIEPLGLRAEYERVHGREVIS